MANDEETQKKTSKLFMPLLVIASVVSWVAFYLAAKLSAENSPDGTVDWNSVLLISGCTFLAVCLFIGILCRSTKFKRQQTQLVKHPLDPRETLNRPPAEVPVEERGEPRSNKGCTAGCLFVVIYWTVVFSASELFDAKPLAGIMAFVFLLGLLLYTLSGRLSKRLDLNPNNLTLKQDLEQAGRHQDWAGP